mgnify:CR=1 FL=1
MESVIGINVTILVLVVVILAILLFAILFLFRQKDLFITFMKSLHTYSKK